MRKIILSLFFIFSLVVSARAEDFFVKQISQISQVEVIGKAKEAKRPTDSMFLIPINIPAKVKIIVCELQVTKELISADGATTFHAYWDDGSGELFGFGSAINLKQGTLFRKLYDLTGKDIYITTKPLNIRIVSDMGTFDPGGEIKATVYYIEEEVNQ
jgi:hypothetical protein